MEDLGLERGAHGHAHVEGFLGSSKNTFTHTSFHLQVVCTVSTRSRPWTATGYEP